MDVHDDIKQDDTVGSADCVGIETNDITGAKTVKYSGASPDKPILKDAKTGKFIAGTGTSGKGGRKKGSKDRVSQAMVDLATELVANRGSELFAEMADRDPAQALALVTKIIPPEEMRALFSEDRVAAETQDTNVTINLVSAPSPRLSDSRSDQQITDTQRGLTRPVERIEKPSEDAVVATQVDADEEAARAERERQERQRDAIKAHGGLTGRAARRSAPDVIEYRDDGEVI